MEENPLFSLKTSDKDKPFSNMRGRPTTEKMIIFSQQPQSAVSQLLSKMKTEKISVIRHTIDEIKTEKNPSPEREEKNLFEDTGICEICSYRSEDIKEFRKHMATHKQYSCDFTGCSYTCKLSSNLIKHKRVHTDERPYLCDRCSFRTNFVNSLKAHKRIHTSERPYLCKHCSYKCNSSSNLKKHCLHRHPDVIK